MDARHDSLRVLVICGGATDERDVSVRSGRRVANALHSRGFTVRVADLDQSLIDTLRDFAPHVVWPLVHGSIGEDGSLQALLEASRQTFVGAPSVNAMWASNKPTAKSLLAREGIATPQWIALPQGLFRQLGATHVLDEIVGSIAFPAVVKPTDGGSALGMSKVSGPRELRSALVDAFAYGQRVMIERFVAGKEVAVSVADVGDGPRALPPVEIETESGRYDYESRYTTGNTRYFVPARLPAAHVTRVQGAAVRGHRILGLRHISRFDFIVDRAGTPWFIDANVAPGMTDTSLFPQAAQAAGSFAELVDHITLFAAGQASPAA